MRPVGGKPQPKQVPSRSGQARPALPFQPFETFEAQFVGFPEGTGGVLKFPGLPKGSDILVEWGDGSGAIHGDKVMAELAGETRDGRPTARIVKILARTDQPVAAKLSKQPWGWRAIPLDPRMQQVVSVGASDLAEDGDWVSLQLDPDPKLPQIKGTVVARLGRPTDLKIENRLTAVLYHLRDAFPPAVLEELAPFPTRIPEDWLKNREDLRQLLTVTIDPPTAKDYDDAISLEVLPKEEGGGWLLGVHIADVSHYVAEGGPLDTEAQLRGTSVYFPDECIPMIPERLSSELCSLQPDVDRLTLTAWMTISPDLTLVETRFSESVIHSRKRLTYDQVKAACLDCDQVLRTDLGEAVCGMLADALALGRKLTAQRLDRGAMNLDTEETEFVFDETGKPVDARRYPRHDAHKMIEEFMLMANEAVATLFTRKKLPTIYRIHDEPDPMKLDVFKGVALAFGLLKPNDMPTPDVLNALLDKIRGGPLEAMLNTLLLRSLKKAEYSAQNIGHSGLALDDYLHFTSPIRRYPDLIVHRLLRHYLRGKAFAPGLEGHLAILAKQASDAEQKATEAERENDKWKTCLLMQDKVGQKYQGRIQGFNLKAAFVRLESPFVEVGVPLGALGGGFQVNEHRTAATGMGGLALSIGAKVTVEITAVDMDLRRVSAWILEAEGQDAKGKTLTFVPTLAAPATLREADFVPEPRGPKPRNGGGRPPRPERQKLPKGSIRGPKRRK